jgi:hypothetical protein
MSKNYRVCDCCGKQMNKGYYDAGAYYCSDRCLIWGNSSVDTLNLETFYSYTAADWEKDCEDCEDCYYTEWDE